MLNLYPNWMANWLAAICAHFTRLGKRFSPFWLANPCLHPLSLAIVKAAQHNTGIAKTCLQKRITPFRRRRAFPPAWHRQEQSNGCARLGHHRGPHCLLSGSSDSFKTDWQRHVLASSGYLELGMFDDAALVWKRSRQRIRTASRFQERLLLIQFGQRFNK